MDWYRQQLHFKGIFSTADNAKHFKSTPYQQVIVRKLSKIPNSIQASSKAGTDIFWKREGPKKFSVWYCPQEGQTRKRT